MSILGFGPPDLNNLREVYITQLRQLLSNEEQLSEALPKLAEKSTEPKLKQAFETHLRETQQHAIKVRDLLSQLGVQTDALKCKVTATLISEGEAMVGAAKSNAVRDAVLIGAGQQAEHHEIAVYGTVRRYAELLGEAAQVQVLDEILSQEKHADELLTQIADSVNPRAQRAA